MHSLRPACSVTAAAHRHCAMAARHSVVQAVMTPRRCVQTVEALKRRPVLVRAVQLGAADMQELDRAFQQLARQLHYLFPNSTPAWRANAAIALGEMNIMMPALMAVSLDWDDETKRAFIKNAVKRAKRAAQGAAAHHTPGALPGRLAAALHNAPSSSELCKVPGYRETQKRERIFANFRDVDIVGIKSYPAALLHPVFGDFLDMVEGRTPVPITKADATLVWELATDMQKVYPDKAARMRVVHPCFQYLFENLIYKPDPGSALSPKDRADALILCNIPGIGEQLVAVLEGKNEVGTGSGDAYIQCSASYIYCLEGASNAAVVSDHSCCPAFGIEIVGPHVRVSALAVSIDSERREVAVTEPLTTLMVLVMALQSLKSFYETRIPQFRDGNITDFQQLPYALAENPVRFQQPQLLDPGKKMTIFTATENLGNRTRPVLCKFVRNYGEGVHRVWADKGHAPAFYERINLAGGWQLLVMEYLSANDNWKSVDELQRSLTAAQFNTLRDAMSSALAVVHAAPLSDHSSNSSSGHGSRPGLGLTAHGDLRAPNIMARCANDRWEVKFIDFDWAGEAGVTTYPYFMNHISLQWPPGASDGEVLQQEHDRWWVERLSSTSGSSRRRTRGTQSTWHAAAATQPAAPRRRGQTTGGNAIS